MDNTSTLRFFTRVSDLAQHPPEYGIIMNQSFIIYMWKGGKWVIPEN
jgi:hypothetical protein